jgi:capsular exopolysaccharide synthesis family protein
VDLRDYLDILRARWRLITVTTLLGVMAAALASMLATPMYTSTATTFVQVNAESDGDGASAVNDALSGSYFAQQRVKSYVQAVTGDDVMEAVIEDLGLPLTAGQLAGKISVNNPIDTVNLEISVTDPNPVTAQSIANRVAEQLGSAVASLEIPTNGGDPLVDMKVLTPAAVPTSPSSPRTMINLALGFLVGLAVGVGAAVLLETLDTRIKSIETLAKHFDQPLLGVIGYEADAEKKPLLTDVQGQSKRAESFRQVRTNLQFVDIDHRPKSIVVTSAVPREGKSTTAINLAITIAQTGQPVFLIEADLRRPKVAGYLNIEGGAGLTDVLVGRATVDEVMQPWGASGNLWVMASGPLPPNPSELLGSQSMTDLIHHLEKRATLIIDAPPLLPVTDAAVLTRLTGGALLVIATGKTRREQLRTAEQSIEAVGGKILGLVMNMAPARGPDSHRYGYGYQYDYRAIEDRGMFDDHAPVIPAGFGGLPGVNGSATPTFPGTTKNDTETTTPAPSADSGAGHEPAPRSAARASVQASEAPVVVSSKSAATQEPETDVPSLTSVVAAEDKVIGGSGGVPLADAISPYGQRTVLPHVDLLRADTASGARFGLDDDVPLSDVGEVPVGDAPSSVIGDVAGAPAVDPYSPAQASWTPPRPRAALDPLTAPYEEVQVADLRDPGRNEES